MPNRKRKTGDVTKASIYVRLSLAKDGDTLGVQRQEEECRAFCERQGWDVRDVFTDNDVSATTGVVRPGFEALLASKPEVIVCWHTDRLARLSSDLERVLELKVNVHGLAAGYLDLSTPAGRATARTITAWAQYEGEQKAERQRSSARQRAKAGRPWWPRRPFGLERDGSLRDDEAEALRKAYRDLLEGASVASLARDLNDKGHTTNTGKAWSASSLRPVLLNARNAAVRVYEGEEIGPASWEAIVPEETWRAAVHLLNGKARKSGGGGPRQSLLTGVATCGVCGSGVRTAWRGTKGEPGSYQVYECKGEHCVSHRVSWVDRYVSTRARPALIELANDGARGSDGDVDTAALREETTVLHLKLDELAEDYADGAISRRERNTSSERVRSRLGEIEEALATAGRTNALASVDQEVIDGWEGLGVDRKRVYIEAAFDSVELMRRGRGVREMKPEHVRLTRLGADEPMPF